MVDVAEIYSLPRVTKEAIKFVLLAGGAMDLTTGWDFSKPGDRDVARTYVRQNKPLLLIGSPMCTPFSNIQNLNKDRRDPGIVKEEKDRARLHLAWCCRLYRRTDVTLQLQANVLGDFLGL